MTRIQLSNVENLINNRKNKMQSNIYTSKIHKPSKTKQEASENSVKTAYKGKTWKRGNDKREMYNYCAGGALK